MIREETDGIVIYRWEIFEPWRNKFAAILTTRLGGTSQPPFDGLNLGHLVNDNSQTLKQNRKLAAIALNLPDSSIIFCNQIHGTRISALSDLPSPGEPLFKDTDGILVDMSERIAGILLADCHPVIVYDMVRNIAGIAHAGWRGALGGIPRILVERLTAIGSKTDDIVAAVGPGIGPCCYTVRDDVANMFREGIECQHNQKNGQELWRLDLEKVNRCALIAAGVPDSQIQQGGFCTACNTDEFFSWRKENGNTGRYAALTVLY